MTQQQQQQLWNLVMKRIFSLKCLKKLIFRDDIHYIRASLVAQLVKNPLAMHETWVLSLGWEDPLEKEMATPSSNLAGRIPRTEKPGRLQSMGLQESDTT